MHAYYESSWIQAGIWRTALSISSIDFIICVSQVTVSFHLFSVLSIIILLLLLLILFYTCQSSFCFVSCDFEFLMQVKSLWMYKLLTGSPTCIKIGYVQCITVYFSFKSSLNQWKAPVAQTDNGFNLCEIMQCVFLL